MVVTDRRDDSALPTYARLGAPPGLKTRRQLRAQGRSPGSQEVAGLLKFRRHGREIVAYLFDIAASVPKRSATPAQLAALREGNRERQIQAAERRGYSRASLTVEGDPGPGWDSPTPPQGAAVPTAQIQTQAHSPPETAASLIVAATTPNQPHPPPVETASAQSLPPDTTAAATPAVKAQVQQPDSSTTATPLTPIEKGHVMPVHEEEQIVVESAQLVQASALALISARQAVKQWAVEREREAAERPPAQQQEQTPPQPRRGLFGRIRSAIHNATRERPPAVQAQQQEQTPPQPRRGLFGRIRSAIHNATRERPRTVQAQQQPVQAQQQNPAPAQPHPVEAMVADWAAKTATHEYAVKVEQGWRAAASEADQRMRAAGVDPDRVRVKAAEIEQGAHVAAQPTLDPERVAQLVTEYTLKELNAARAVIEQQNPTPQQAATPTAATAAPAKEAAAPKAPAAGTDPAAAKKAAPAKKATATKRPAAGKAAGTGNAAGGSAKKTAANLINDTQPTPDAKASAAQQPAAEPTAQQQQATQQAAAATEAPSAGVAP
ncbi:hypothetical protein [Nocardia sp. NBC_01327]|uniref:hypothetical protein n=1 Tax=Nocardia sp. NBC_01327 TaxID=2903593 RepID=UPI002E0D9BD4|nr:hypothetical protein OG326_42510 [Nocardia sp. NBC_01327]